jgi:hypothetical protein
MRTSSVTAVVLALLASGTVALWIALHDDSSRPVDLATEERSSETSPPSASNAEPPDSLGGEPAFEAARPTSSARIEVPAPVDETAAIVGPSAPVRGHLRDASTGEALPDFLLVARDAAGHRAEITTDPHGDFVSQTSLALGALTIAFPDRPGRVACAEPQTVQRDAESGDLDLRIACGPTFWLDVQPAREIDLLSLEARLSFVASDASRDQTEPEPVRAGEGAWIRFGPIAGAGDGTAADALDVASRDGYWRGRARVRELHGRVAAIVPVTLAACAVLEVRATSLDGAPIDGADLFLNWTSAGGKASKSSGRTAADGTYTFKYIASGDGTLSARSMRFGPDDVPVHLVAKATSKVDVHMEKLPLAGAIRGKIASETGTYALPVDVVLNAPASANSSGRGPRAWHATPAWSVVDGKSIGTFSFDDLPKGRYRVDVQHRDDFFRWEPSRVDVDAPNESAAFLVHDAVPNAGIAFRVRDGDNGLLLDGLRISLDIRGGPSRIVSASSNDVLYSRLPTDRKITWRVDKDEYQPAFGDESAFVTEEARADQRVRFAEVTLEPGWGDVIRVVVAAGKGDTPIEGAHVLLDDRDAGATGKDGTLRVFSKRKPAHLGCTYKNWNVAGKIDLSPPWARSDRNFVRVEMRPPQKKPAPAK